MEDPLGKCLQTGKRRQGHDVLLVCEAVSPSLLMELFSRAGELRLGLSRWAPVLGLAVRFRLYLPSR